MKLQDSLPRKYFHFYTPVIPPPPPSVLETFFSSLLSCHSPFVTAIEIEFRVFYLDDGTLGGTESDVLHDFQLIDYEAAALGLQLNHSKSKLICDELADTDILNVTTDLCKVSRESTTVIGSPISLFHSISTAITEKVSALKTMTSRLFV